MAGAAAIGLSSETASATVRARPKKPRPGDLPNPNAPAGSDQLPELSLIHI